MARKPDKTLLKWLDASPLGVYLIQSDQSLGYLNSALADRLQSGLDQLIGTPCRFSAFPSRDSTESLVSGLAPPPDAPTNAPITASIMIPHRDGRRETLPAHFVPLLGPQDGHPAWLAIVQPTPNENTHRQNPVESKQLPTLGAETVRQLAAQLLSSAGAASDELRTLPGTSAEAERIRRAAVAVAAGRSDVTIWGPTGSGRSFLAQSIASEGTKPNPIPAVVIDASSIDAESMQRALVHACRDLPREARTVLLRNVDRLSGEAAAELQGFLRLPDHSLRLLATSDRPMRESADTALSCELRCRLGTLEIEIVPLRDRPQDIPLLAQTLLESAVKRSNAPACSFSGTVLQWLIEYTWPGEVAELKSTIEGAIERCSTPLIEPADLPERFHYARQAALAPRVETAPIDLESQLTSIERQLIERALHLARGNKAAAARLLSINRGRLLRRAEQLGIGFGAFGVSEPSERDEDRSE